MPKGIYDRSKSQWKPWPKGKPNPNLAGKKNPRWNSVEKVCEICGATFFIRKSHAHARRNCSAKCMGIWKSKNKSGANSHMWKGGKSRSWSVYKGGFSFHLKKAIREKYKNKCTFCSSEVRLQVHHVNEDPKDNREENLVLLCTSCHVSFHRLSEQKKGINRLNGDKNK